MRPHPQDRKAVAKYGAPPSNQTNAFAETREIAREGVRVRERNVGAPPRIRSKRDRSANQENR